MPNLGKPDASLVSVIVPVFNQREYVPEVVECLRRQTHPNIETIFVDDGSTDGSGDLLEELVGSSDRIIHQANQGLAAARNAGLKHAAGEFIQLLDADDLISNDKLSHDVEYLARHPEACLVSCEVHFFRHSLARQRRAELVFPYADLFVALLGGNPLPAHAPLFSKQVLDQVRGFDTKLVTCEDWDFWLRTSAAGFKGVFVPGVRAFYRLRAGQMSGSPQNMVAGAASVLARARQLVGRKRIRPDYAFPLLDSHARWSLRARALNRTDLADEFAQCVTEWPDVLPGDYTHPEYTPARSLDVWTNVVVAFAHDPATQLRAKQEWEQAAEHVRVNLDPAGVRALLRSQQSFVRSGDRRLADVIERADSLAKEWNGMKRKPARCRADGTHVQAALDLLRAESVRRVLIYGGGEHTRWLLTEFDLSDFEIVGIMDDDAELWETRILDIPVMAPRSAAGAGCDGVLISSDQHEDRMAERARQVFPITRVYGMYETRPNRAPVPAG